MSVLETIAENNESNANEKLGKKLYHLSVDVSEEVARILNGSDVVAASFHDLGPANVPVQHSFELKNEKQIHQDVRRMAPKHKEIALGALNLMLKVKLITPAASVWFFPVVLATKKQEKQLLCVDYRTLN